MKGVAGFFSPIIFNIRQNRDLKPIVEKIMNLQQEKLSQEISSELRMLNFYLSTGAIILLSSKELVYIKSNHNLVPVSEKLNKTMCPIDFVSRELQFVRSRSMRSYQEKVDEQINLFMMDYQLKKHQYAQKGFFLQPCRNHVILLTDDAGHAVKDYFLQIQQINKVFNANFNQNYQIIRNLNHQDAKSIKWQDDLDNKEMRERCERCYWGEQRASNPRFDEEMQQFLSQGVMDAFMNIMDTFDATKTLVLPLQNIVIPVQIPENNEISQIVSEVFQFQLSKVVWRISEQPSMLFIIDECKKMANIPEIESGIPVESSESSDIREIGDDLDKWLSESTLMQELMQMPLNELGSPLFHEEIPNVTPQIITPIHEEIANVTPQITSFRTTTMETSKKRKLTSIDKKSTEQKSKSIEIKSRFYLYDGKSGNFKRKS